MFSTILIANRGAIATRIIRTLRSLQIRAVCVYNEADAQSLHVQLADEAISLGEGSAADTYLDIDKILAAAQSSGAEAIHPGYGFLSENTEFVKRCEQVGIAFIGPTAEQIEMFGLKHLARETAENAKTPLVPGSPLLGDVDDAVAWAERVGFPVMLKSTAGGGGIGMQVCTGSAELRGAWDKVKRLSANYFANDGLFLEKYIARARHIEVQVFGDGRGAAVSFGERDCSAQRRNQKVLEETPAPNLPQSHREALCETAERLMASVRYRNAGTVEFIYDDDAGQFYFLEVNTRLQVEHGVTEEVWGVDLVELMIRQAAGELDDLLATKAGLNPRGHAVQVRIYAEDPAQDFRPSSGLVSSVCWPQADNLRIDHWIESGIEVPALFDPMLAKVIVHESDRNAALDKLQEVLSASEIYGIETNIAYVSTLIDSSLCRQGKLLTNSLASFAFKPATVDVLQPGTQTTVQDFPGRTGYWHVGVPPSGPMDSLSFRLANRLLGNSSDAAGLEITLNGPTLRFNINTTVALAGADIEASLDDQPMAMYRTVDVKAGQTLALGKIKSAGARAYLAIAGGIRCPLYLGSRSTFTLGQFGGHVGRALRTGDVLHLQQTTAGVSPASIESRDRPVMRDVWQLRVIYGPHGAPDFFRQEDINEFFAAEWEVHYNSSRTGIRLIGPKPEWARETGGEAGLHPSNIHDNAYAFGTVDFTGDMPVLLGPDGPSLGGFVCPATVVQADLWKLGQLKAGAKVRFVPITHQQAVAMQLSQNEAIEQLRIEQYPLDAEPIENVSPILKRFDGGEEVVYRLAGDQFILVELGPQELNIERRFKVHTLMLWLENNRVQGIRELTPGIRSLQVHYDPQVISLTQLTAHLDKACEVLEDAGEHSIPSRIVHLPLSWDDEACREAIAKYMQSVRPDAPWCPSNLEFIRRINGLNDLEAVRDIVFGASYLVMGLGDVYLGAPVATPLDPRHRLVTTKYNPARTWTAENSVGIGGAYMCIYGMEGPGGYQFVGRTLQMWNRYRKTDVFDQPWLLRFFDQIRFYPVTAEELKRIRKDFPLGKFEIRIEQSQFNLSDYNHFVAEHSQSIKSFQEQRTSAFDRELNWWRETGQLTYQQVEAEAVEADAEMPEGVNSIDSPVSGSVWQLLVEEGQDVVKGQKLLVLESMKMEIEIEAKQSGRVEKLLKGQGQGVTVGQSLLWLRHADNP